MVVMEIEVMDPEEEEVLWEVLNWEEVAWLGQEVHLKEVLVILRKLALQVEEKEVWVVMKVRLPEGSRVLGT